MFNSGKVHLIEADEIEPVGIPAGITERIDKTCVGGAVQHGRRIEITEDVGIIRPRRAHGNHAEFLLR